MAIVRPLTDICIRRPTSTIVRCLHGTWRLVQAGRSSQDPPPSGRTLAMTALGGSTAVLVTAAVVAMGPLVPRLPLLGVLLVAGVLFAGAPDAVRQFESHMPWSKATGDSQDAATLRILGLIMLVAAQIGIVAVLMNLDQSLVALTGLYPEDSARL